MVTHGHWSATPSTSAGIWMYLRGSYCRHRRARSSKMAARNDSSHLRAKLAALDLQSTPELFHSFFHSYDSHARSFAYRRAVQHSAGYTPPVIADGDCQPFCDVLDLDAGLGASGVQVNICKAGLHNSEDREFCLFG